AVGQDGGPLPAHAHRGREIFGQARAGRTAAHGGAQGCPAAPPRRRRSGPAHVTLRIKPRARIRRSENGNTQKERNAECLMRRYCVKAVPCRAFGATRGAMVTEATGTATATRPAAS